MEYGRGDGIPFDFEPCGIPFGLKLKRELSSRSYPIQCERNWKYSFLSAQDRRACQAESLEATIHRNIYLLRQYIYIYIHIHI